MRWLPTSLKLTAVLSTSWAQLKSIWPQIIAHLCTHTHTQMTMDFVLCLLLRSAYLPAIRWCHPSVTSHPITPPPAPVSSARWDERCRRDCLVACTPTHSLLCSQTGKCVCSEQWPNNYQLSILACSFIILFFLINFSMWLCCSRGGPQCQIFCTRFQNLLNFQFHEIPEDFCRFHKDNMYEPI